MDFKKEPWTDDLNEFLAYLNPKSKSYEDVKKAIEIAWPLAFKKYATMLIWKDESEGQELLTKVEKQLNWEADFDQWFELKGYPDDVKPALKNCWEESYNTYVLYGQTQAQMDQFVEKIEKESE